MHVLSRIFLTSVGPPWDIPRGSTPKFCIRSALPVNPVTATNACFATLIPLLATIKAAGVLMLVVFTLSPPVPARELIFSGSTPTSKGRTNCSLVAVKPTSPFLVSPSVF